MQCLKEDTIMNYNEPGKATVHRRLHVWHPRTPSVMDSPVLGTYHRAEENVTNYQQGWGASFCVTLVMIRHDCLQM